MATEADFAMIGMAVMGRNLAFNLLDHGVDVIGYNREPEMLASAIEESGGKLKGAADYPALVAGLKRPRRIMMMIKAGKPVDMVLGDLLPLLDAGDVVIDGGNSYFRDTERRQTMAAEKGVHFLGVGVSGGERGARRGPSLMPGGSAEGYALVAPMLESIAATTTSGPCVTHVGTGGAGHFVKMVHNGIEYADMQLLAEGYDLMRRLLGLQAPAIAEVFARYNEGPLESFLVEITAAIFSTRDGDEHAVNNVLDRAGQKGTGRWTAQLALELGVPVPSIAAAITARVLSSLKDERVKASADLFGPPPASLMGRDWVDRIEQALEAAKIIAYAQGMALIRAGSDEFGWGIKLSEMARIWTGGCIIRARLLDAIMSAYGRDPELPNLMMDTALSDRLAATQGALRQLVALAAGHGVAVPALSASLAYYDSYRTARLPQNLTQAQRDAFGAHTYQRADAPDGPAQHTDWLKGTVLGG